MIDFDLCCVTSIGGAGPVNQAACAARLTYRPYAPLVMRELWTWRLRIGVAWEFSGFALWRNRLLLLELLRLVEQAAPPTGLTTLFGCGCRLDAHFEVSARRPWWAGSVRQAAPPTGFISPTRARALQIGSLRFVTHLKPTGRWAGYRLEQRLVGERLAIPVGTRSWR